MTATDVKRRTIPPVDLTAYHCEIAKIESTFLGVEDHGILTFFLHLAFGGGGQGAGGYALDSPSPEWEWPSGRYGSPERIGVPSSIAVISAVLNACGVDQWEKLPGRTIFALKAAKDVWGPIVGLAPLPTEPGRAFLFRELFERHRS